MWCIGLLSLRDALAGHYLEPLSVLKSSGFRPIALRRFSRRSFRALPLVGLTYRLFRCHSHFESLFTLSASSPILFIHLSTNSLFSFSSFALLSSAKFSCKP